MNNDINSAKILDADQNKIIPELIGRLGKKGFGMLNGNVFQPYIPSKNIFIKSQKIATKLGIENPLTKAIGEMANIRAQLFQVNLDEDQFPTINNSFDITLGSELMSSVNSILPTGVLPAATSGFTGQENVSIPNTGELSFDQLKNQDQKLQRISNVDSLLNT